jgi:hypothetical protein
MMRRLPPPQAASAITKSSGIDLQRTHMKRVWVLLLAGLVFTGCTRSSTSSSSKPSAGHAASDASLNGDGRSWENSAHLQTASMKPPTTHPVYPFSLVSGGVYSASDLARALATSNSLRAHYANFDFKHVRLIRIQNDTPAFVSYRKDGKIFWTKHKLTLRAGELVLADGRYLVRARCANQISFAPQEPVDPIPSDVEQRIDVPMVPTPMDYTRLREVSSPLLPPEQFAPPATFLARAYTPAAASPMLRTSPVCTNCSESYTPTPSFAPKPKPPKTPQQREPVPVPMPDTDGLTLAFVGLLMMASLLILKGQKNSAR